jgi:hypothetical protein
MPQPILDAIQAARGDLDGTLENEEYRKRLQDKFGNRWTVPTFVRARVKGEKKDAAPQSSEEDEYLSGQDGGGGSGVARRVTRKRYQRALRGGEESGEMRDLPVAVPRYEYAKADCFARPWHLAAWDPTHLLGPTVLLNSESPILEEIIRHHRDQYPDVYSEEVTKTVRTVFGQIATCKVAHAQKLTAHMTEPEVDEQFRSEPALTIALMGLIAEETVIALHLGRLGKKKVAPSSGASGKKDGDDASEPQPLVAKVR